MPVVVCAKRTCRLSGTTTGSCHERGVLATWCQPTPCKTIGRNGAGDAEVVDEVRRQLWLSEGEHVRLGPGFEEGDLQPALVERFGLFTIVVLGEVVFGASTACPRRTGTA